jgi:hypothetical protein
MQEYLIRKTGDNRPAHLWNGIDTACHMASTGGLSLKRYEVHTDRRGRSICRMCLINAEKERNQREWKEAMDTVSAHGFFPPLRPGG